MAWPVFCAGYEGWYRRNDDIDFEMAKPCKRSWCPRCLEYRTKIVAEAIADCRADHFITLTWLPETWASIHRLMTSIDKRAERRGFRTAAWKKIYVVEFHEEPGRAHVHMLAYGESPPEPFWIETLHQMNGSGVHITPARLDHGRYLTKDYRHRGTSCYRCCCQAIAIQRALNGGLRILHGSQDFFRTPTGEIVGTLAAAEARIRARRRQSNPAAWYDLFDAEAAMQQISSAHPVQPGDSTTKGRWT